MNDKEIIVVWEDVKPGKQIFLSYNEAILFSQALSMIPRVTYVEIYTHHVNKEYDDLFCWWGPASIHYGDVRHLSIVGSQYLTDSFAGDIWKVF